LEQPRTFWENQLPQDTLPVLAEGKCPGNNDFARGDSITLIGCNNADGTVVNDILPSFFLFVLLIEPLDSPLVLILDLRVKVPQKRKDI